MEFNELDDSLLRQCTDAFNAYEAYLRARAESKLTRGGMIWRQVSGREYLIRTSTSGAQQSLGPKSPETEKIYEKFIAKKTIDQETLRQRLEAVQRHERMNRALRVGRVPTLVVDLLRALEQAGLASFFRVVGTFSIYAYESAAGVRLVNDVLQTQDVDLLWDAQRRIQFVTSLEKTDERSLIAMLRKVDKTFRVRQDQPYTATNDTGFEVDILRRIPKLGDPHPLQISEDEDDFWAVPASTAESLTSAPPFSQVVVANNGRMARMHTVHPLTFVKIKEWLAGIPDRDPLKRRRDRSQSEAVLKLVELYLPHLAKEYREGRPKPVGHQP